MSELTGIYGTREQNLIIVHMQYIYYIGYHGNLLQPIKCAVLILLTFSKA